MRKSILGILLFFVLSFTILLLWSYGDCVNQNWHKRNTMNGTISIKFIDSLNHNAYSLRLNDQEVYRIMGFNKIQGGNKTIYDSIIEGDSLIKEEGTLDLVIIRGDQRMVFTHDTGCDENWWKFWKKLKF